MNCQWLDPDEKRCPRHATRTICVFSDLLEHPWFAVAVCSKHVGNSSDSIHNLHAHTRRKAK